MCSREEWLHYKNLPERRPFAFFNLLPAPTPDAIGDASDLNIAEHKTREDVRKTSLYAAFTKQPEILSLEEYKSRGEGNEGLYRTDNNRFPAEIFDIRYELTFVTVAECLIDHFTRHEFKSIGRYGYLNRRSLVICEHAYIGKETNAIAEEDADDTEMKELNRVAGRDILQQHVNSRLIRGLNASELSVAAGVSELTIKQKLMRGRRLSDKAMRQLHSCLRIGDDGNTYLTKPKNFNATEKRVETLRRKLRILYNASATPGEIAAKIVKHIPEENISMRTVQYMKQIVNSLWTNEETSLATYINETSFHLFEAALNEAFGQTRIERQKAEKNMKLNVVRASYQAAARNNRKEAEKQRRLEIINVIVSPHKSPSEPSLDAQLSSVLGDSDPLVYLIVLALSLFGLLYACAQFAKEISTALRKTMTHASTETAPSRFDEYFSAEIERREQRKEQTRARVAKHRSLHAALLNLEAIPTRHQ